MSSVLARISQVNKDAIPAIVTFTFSDAKGQEHAFAEKEPVIFELCPSANEPYPTFAEIPCRVLEYWQDASGRQLCLIDTELPWGIESSEGETKFIVLASHLVPPTSAQQVRQDGLPGSSSR